MKKYGFAAIPLVALLTGCMAGHLEMSELNKPDFPAAPSEPVYKVKIAESFDRSLKDPESKRLRFEPPKKAIYLERGYTKCGWCVKVWCNAKNGYGGYTGEEPYWFWFQGDDLVRTKAAWAVSREFWQRDTM